MKKSFLNILGVKIANINYDEILNLILTAVSKREQITITYAHIETTNQFNKNQLFRNSLKQFDIIHPDGTGVYLASRFLFGKEGFDLRFSGSDFYPVLIRFSILENLSFFFLGDNEETLKLIPIKNTDLKIKGYCNGFNFVDNEVITEINNIAPDILIVGLGSPKQELWIVKYKSQLNVKVIIAVGDGIKVFADTKYRGPKVIQNIGLEWLVRLYGDPIRLWKRYLLGIPRFIYSILKEYFKLKFNFS